MTNGNMVVLSKNDIIIIDMISIFWKKYLLSIYFLVTCSLQNPHTQDKSVATNFRLIICRQY